MFIFVLTIWLDGTNFTTVRSEPLTKAECEERVERAQNRKDTFGYTGQVEFHCEPITKSM